MFFYNIKISANYIPQYCRVFHLNFIYEIIKYDII